MTEASRVVEVPFQTELGDSFGRYAQKVILDRAIPDVRDGLKPVQRRIVYAMFDAGNTHDKPYRKAAKTVGDVMGNYHPHGDSSIYDAMVRMAQPWKMRYPLVDGHGNFGSMDDDPPAAMRYTEARLSEIASELMRDIDKDTVTWKPNFDEKSLEPVVLPAGFLNLLINGTSGVSAGFATEIPSHHLGEIVDATLAVMRTPSIDLDELMAYVPGPDFPTGGILMGRDGIREAYETGRGKVVLRSRHTIEEQKDRQLLVFNELPYNVIKADLVRDIDEMRLGKEVIGIADVRDESDREGLRVVVELTKGADADVVLAYLFKKTNLQVSYHFNMVAIARNTPVQMGLRQILDAFIQHRQRVVMRRSRHDREKKAARLHEVEGLIKAVDILDEVIATIRASRDKAEARVNLVANFDFTELQAEAILELKLHRLTNLELHDLQVEAGELEKAVKRLDKIIGSRKELDKVVVSELEEIKRRFSDERRTTLEDVVEKPAVDLLKATVKDQEVVVGVTRAGWVKQSSLGSFNASGATRKTSGVRPGDRMLRLLHTRTTHTVLAFSNTGQCYPIPVHQLPEAKWGETGTALVNVCGISRDEALVDLIDLDPKAVAVGQPVSDRPSAFEPVVVPDGEAESAGEGGVAPGRYLLFVTRHGAVKLTPTAEFLSTRSSGIVALKLADGDQLARVIETDGQGEVLLLTRGGQGIRSELGEVSVQGRAARGVAGLKPEKDDEVTDAVVLDAYEVGDPEVQIAVFTSSGRGKRTPLEQFPKQRRGGKGVRMIVASLKSRVECVALSKMRDGDGFEIVDSNGNEHFVESRRIQNQRRDGIAYTLVNLKEGATVT
ncbi:MAG: DNA topoisomerase 4 subunit A, partial [Deltaproteobacteria bacterium]|nr:DNA topoisomerase 4 subunit A [Deltaproteobacteria bacterium]